MQRFILIVLVALAAVSTACADSDAALEFACESVEDTVFLSVCINESWDLASASLTFVVDTADVEEGPDFVRDYIFAGIDNSYYVSHITGDTVFVALCTNAGIPLAVTEGDTLVRLAFLKKSDLSSGIKAVWLRYPETCLNEQEVWLGDDLEPVVGIDDSDAGLPHQVVLEQNAPNPFNPETAIRYALPAGAVTRLAVYDLTGGLVRTLVNGYQSAGTHSAVWNGRNNAGQPVASGIYVYRLTNGVDALTRRMTYLR